MRFVRTESTSPVMKINWNTEKESLEPWSTQWGLAFSSPMSLSVYRLKMRRNLKSELKEFCLVIVFVPHKLLPLLLFIPASNMGYFKIFYYSSSQYLNSASIQRYLDNLFLLISSQNPRSVSLNE
jgi:hypothetical protein